MLQMERMDLKLNMWAMKHVLIVMSSLLMEATPLVWGKKLPNCSYPAIYSFGDSLTDTGNSIAAFPDQFAKVELDPYGTEWPMHGADRYCDGKVLDDFLEFGFRGTPNYPYLRSIAGVFEYGTNFASAGGSARNVTGWKPDNGFNTPFSLNVQLQWFQRYKVRIEVYYYYKNTLGDAAVVAQTLPTEASLNQSLYMVYAGFHDYFFDLYEKKRTPGEGLDSVPDVTAAITTTIEGLIAAGALTMLVVNLPPLGCIPALLTLYSGATGNQYDEYGCLKELNLITATHNEVLSDEVIKLRAKYPKVYFYYGNVHDVYTDILKAPSKYNVTHPLKAACGYGGEYNFNEKVQCGETGYVGNKFVNLTKVDHAVAAKYLSYDGIHLSNTANKAIAKAFFDAKHITPAGGFKCTPDYSRFDGRT
ncbi:hypothetical protein M758_11G130200 [Ceratodon purpureus]|nr:hypothetical protein M758_11G130200 [Ceratodon purpureus]